MIICTSTPQTMYSTTTTELIHTTLMDYRTAPASLMKVAV